MAGKMAGKVALVTGGASGIGRATALAFAREGARLVVADMQEEEGRNTASLIAAQGGEAIFVQTDVTSSASVAALMAATVDRYGRLDYAHNNAGITGKGIGGAGNTLTAEYPEERWHEVIAVNLTGVWLCMRHEITQMLKQGGGAIVNSASAAGLVGSPPNSAYSASKHGVVGLTKTAALEYARQGIRINCVCPWFIHTPMTDPGPGNPERLAQMAESTPMGRIGVPEDVAAAVIWLCSAESAFVTGYPLAIDGGYVAQ